MKNKIKQRTKIFECLPRCEFLRLEGITFNCDKCIKYLMRPLTPKQKEKILVILNEKENE